MIYSDVSQSYSLGIPERYKVNKVNGCVSGEKRDNIAHLSEIIVNYKIGSKT